jgi:hypothetical protein
MTGKYPIIDPSSTMERKPTVSDRGLMDQSEISLIAEYKFWSRKLPLFESLSGYWVSDYDDSIEELTLLNNYLISLRAYLKPLRQTTKLRQKHFEQFIQGRRYECPSHRHWRLEMNSILEDAEFKYRKWKRSQESKQEPERDSKSAYIPNLTLISPEVEKMKRTSTEERNNTYSSLYIDPDIGESTPPLLFVYGGEQFETHHRSDSEQIASPPQLSASEKKRRKRLQYQHRKRQRQFEKQLFDLVDESQKPMGAIPGVSELPLRSIIMIESRLDKFNSIFICSYPFFLLSGDVTLIAKPRSSLPYYMLEESYQPTKDTWGNIEWIQKQERELQLPEPKAGIYIPDDIPVHEISASIVSLLLNPAAMSINSFSKPGSMEYSHLLFTLSILVHNPFMRACLTSGIEKYFRVLLKLARSGAIDRKECFDKSCYLGDTIGIFVAAIFSQGEIPSVCIESLLTLQMVADGIPLAMDEEIEQNIAIRFFANLHWRMNIHEARAASFNFMAVSNAGVVRPWQCLTLGSSDLGSV